MCAPFFKTMKKARQFEWDEECNMTFLKLKKYRGDFILILGRNGGCDERCFNSGRKGDAETNLLCISHSLRCGNPLPTH
jgi:hypothetical protein